ncbi:MAG TPA: excisionase family DNA-binding protein [Candidatus Stackebrandtia excrementipullorum]|nr:excisionase family DNA-binding protein [Candidatus Stackebrandtia excrementipullorum]
MAFEPKLDQDEQLLTVEEAAELFRTTTRFPRRLIAERRIRFIKLGRYVRIPKSAAMELLSDGVVEPMTSAEARRAA